MKTNTTSIQHSLWLGAALLLTMNGCFANTSNSLSTGYAGGAGATNPQAMDGDQDPNDIPFEPYSLSTATNKIKYIINGTSATDDELAQAGKDGGLASLVTTWMGNPAADRMLMEFFQTAFQQQYVTDITHLTPFDGGMRQDLIKATTESFARTAIDAVKNNTPFNTLYNTKTFMVNTLLLQTMLMADNFDVNDKGQVSDINLKQNPNFTFSLALGGGNTPNLISNNPSDPNYLTWAVVGPFSDNPNCSANNKITINRQTTNRYPTADLWYFLTYGSFNYKGMNNTNCGYNQQQTKAAQPQDQNDWRMVTFNVASGDQDITPFWDLGSLRGANTVTVRTPRIGFMTTPAFFMQWLSNEGNSARGITNQAMIVGLGRGFDGTDQTMPASLASLDSNHAAPNTACYGCHVTMDPMRQYFRQTYTHKFHRQADYTEVTVPGIWAVDGATSVGSGVADFATKMSTHPDVAMTWTRRLCSFLNNVACKTTDPEVMRIAKRFADNQFNFSVLLQDLLVSPLTTNLSKTMTAVKMGVTPTMARKQAFCRALDSRLGVAGNCDMAGLSSSVLAADSYSRGTIEGKLVTTPSLAWRTGLENVCGLIARNYVDSATNNLFPSSDPRKSINALVSTLMGVPTSAAQPYVTVLQQHFDDAVAAGSSAGVAMKSAFVVACLSPKVVMVAE